MRYYIGTIRSKILYIDPYNAIGGLSVPTLKDKVDVLLISHEHHDHNNRNFASDKIPIASATVSSLSESMFPIL